MAPRDRHLDQARRNRSHAEYLIATHTGDPTCLQWTVTAAFYCAVHCMQAYLLDRGLDPRSHLGRANAIADPSNGVPAHIQRTYEALYQLSKKARRAYVRDKILGRDLKVVTDFVGL